MSGMALHDGRTMFVWYSSVKQHAKHAKHQAATGPLLVGVSEASMAKHCPIEIPPLDEDGTADAWPYRKRHTGPDLSYLANMIIALAPLRTIATAGRLALYKYNVSSILEDCIALVVSQSTNPHELCSVSIHPVPHKHLLLRQLYKANVQLWIPFSNLLPRR